MTDVRLINLTETRNYKERQKEGITVGQTNFIK